MAQLDEQDFPAMAILMAAGMAAQDHLGMCEKVRNELMIGLLALGGDPAARDTLNHALHLVDVHEEIARKGNI